MNLARRILEGIQELELRPARGFKKPVTFAEVRDILRDDGWDIVATTDQHSTGDGLIHKKALFSHEGAKGTNVLVSYTLGKGGRVKWVELFKKGSTDGREIGTSKAELSKMTADLLADKPKSEPVGEHQLSLSVDGEYWDVWHSYSSMSAATQDGEFIVGSSDYPKPYKYWKVEDEDGNLEVSNTQSVGKGYVPSSMHDHGPPYGVWTKIADSPANKILVDGETLDYAKAWGQKWLDATMNTEKYGNLIGEAFQFWVVDEAGSMVYMKKGNGHEAG